MALIFVITVVRMAEIRYQPENLAERVVGPFVLLGDMVTSKDLHPRDFIAELTGEKDPGPTDAELARDADDETLEILVERYDMQPGNPFYDELERRKKLEREAEPDPE